MYTPPPPTVSAVLSPQERSRVDAVGDGCFALVHHQTLRDALRMVRERPVDAVLVSLDQCGAEAPALLEQFGRAFPAIPTVALMSKHQEGDPATLLRLGSYGVRQVIDVTGVTGWRKLREVLGAPAVERANAILNPVLDLLRPLSSHNRHFWEELIRGAPTISTVRALANHLEIIPTSFVSRFVRAGLPSPKDHLVGARLCHAAKLFDEGDHTVADVAYRLDFASPQSFARHLRTTLGITPGEFRLRYPFGMMLDRYLDAMVRPHIKIWQEFKAVVPGRGDVDG